LDTPAGDVLVSLSASVLGLRGEGVTAQPLVGKRGALGWNGQVFNGLDLGLRDNDTRAIFDKLEAGESPTAVLQEIEGPCV
jgi:asparagine synthetase B (glutamine-hydrolysing)